MANFYCPSCKNGLTGTETACPKCGRALKPEYVPPPVAVVPGAPPPVEIRRYPSVADFQVDAAQMAAANWHVIAQSESSGGTNSSWVVLAVILGIIGLFLFWPLLIVAVLVLILAAVNKDKVLVVTYRPG